MILETISVGLMQVNCYICALGESKAAIIIDPGGDEAKIRSALAQHKLKPGFIVNTHGHFDHIGCDNSFDVPVYIHKEDAVFLKDPQLNLSGVFAVDYEVKSEIVYLREGQIIESDGLALKVLHVPGHTPGGIALSVVKPEEKILFTGDSLFCQGIGRTDLVFGDEKLLIKSIKEKIMILPDDTVIYPGHGRSSTIGDERRNNPFLA
ncbi:MAG: MBL fold metallo-hydrolase [Candidatus Omnitrophota bacterium]|nr:MBL fold metallo-hydrolase [Candidatus Omnitrophota bacterium]